MTRSASGNFGDASVNMLPRPLPELPPGWIYGERIGGFGPHAIVEDPAFVGERAPRPTSGDVCGGQAVAAQSTSPESEREAVTREAALYGGHAALWRSSHGPTGRR